MTLQHNQTALIEAPYMKENHILGDWAQHADKAVKHLASTGKPFTTDDIRQRIPDGLAPKHNNAWGGLLTTWRKRGVIQAVGYHQSRHKPRHGGVQRQWVGTRQALDE